MLKKIGMKFCIFAMIVIVAVVSVILALLLSTTQSFIDSVLSQQSSAANELFAYSLQNYQDEAVTRAEMIAGSGDIIDAILNEDYEGLRTSLINLSTGFDLITLCDAQGNVLARTHNEKTGDSVLSQAAISTALNTGKGISTIEPGTVIGLSTRGSAAIRDYDGNIIGALTCGHDLSQSKYVDAIKAQNDCEATFFAGSERMATTLFNENGERAIGTKASDEIIKLVLEGKQDYIGQLDLFGTMYSVYYSPVIVNGSSVGMLFTGVNIEFFLAQERGMVVMFIIAAVMLLLAVLITVYIISSTSKKAYWYESMLDSMPFPISVTDMNMKWTFINKPVEQMLSVKRADVIGKHCSNWGAGICNTDNCGINCLRNNINTTSFTQAGADFQVDIGYLSDKRGRKSGHIEIVQDITKTVESQKAQTELVNKIRDVSGSFVSVSKQIANGAQTLAQSSTEQSASVQQLNATVSEVANKTKDNAEMASRAAHLASTIKTNAEKGSQQMDGMMQAVRDINEASQSISKVIKTIDDIAFQTNILALNAAVEAARAGQHGKGFAVVAEEVRSLAAKSADAAKDTSDLISDSIEKAEMGSAIAGETASSLDEIVRGINESSTLISEIATSSEAQSTSIEQINKGIEQVAQVVHLNSATAEESSAAAHELSGQSAVLENLINEFDMKHGSSDGALTDGSSSQKSLPGY